jgi:hypothetical protein
MTRPLTIDDIRGMSEAEINARWSAVQATLRGEEPLPDDLTDASTSWLELPVMTIAGPTSKPR